MTRNEMKNNKKQGIRSTLSRREMRKRKLAGIFVMCFFVVLFCSHAALAGSNTARIVVKAAAAKMIQDGEFPVMKAEAVLDSQRHEKVVLDSESGYTVSDLVREINEGKFYHITCEADGHTEGTYPIVLELDSNLQEKALRDWVGKLEITAEDAELTVSNKYGAWDGDHFKKLDGTIVKNDFVESKGHTYYLGEDGKKVSGFQEIGGNDYYFDKKGVMHTGWLETKDGKYYFNEDGSMRIGWLEEEDGVQYCFGQDGKMLTGEQQVGMKSCVFAKDGKLKSAESKIDLSKPMIALTFDDGPGERTMELLKALEKYDAHATFFMVGTNAAEYQEEIQKMSEIGCELGNHSWDHSNLSSLSAEQVKKQIGSTNDVIKAADGEHRVTVMRPPYGAANDTVKANVGLPMILWSIDTYDWKTLDTQSTINCVLDTAGDGDVVLMHDIHSPSIDAAIALIPKLINKGYQLVTVSELAEAREYQLENGVSYTDFYQEDANDSAAEDPEDEDMDSSASDSEL